MYHQTRVVEGHIVRDTTNHAFSMRRFLLLAISALALALTNPANDLYDRTMSLVDQVIPKTLQQKFWKNQTRKRSTFSSDWAWQTSLDPPVSTTNFGILTVEERYSKVVVLGLTRSWSCNYYNDKNSAFCNALAKNFCHGKPLLYDANDYAYTAHRCLCFLLIATALLSFCYCGQLPAALTKEPLLRAVLTSVGRPQFSLLSLSMDLFNASYFVYPALVKMEQVIPTIMAEGKVASHVGLADHWDFIFYVIVLVIFLGGGSNALANHFSTKEPCIGFDTTMAASLAYCSMFPSSGFALPGSATQHPISLHSVYWVYLPVTAVLGGSPAHAISWLIAGTLGAMLGQFHFDNQNLVGSVLQRLQQFTIPR